MFECGAIIDRMIAFYNDFKKKVLFNWPVDFDSNHQSGESMKWITKYPNDKMALGIA
jgi:hypothetical protein